jgi:hypothetical protein
VAAALYFRKGVVLIALPLTALGVLFYLGRLEPRRWAWRVVLIAPLVTALATGIVPGYRAMTRWYDGHHGARLVEGNGVRLIWTPGRSGVGRTLRLVDHGQRALRPLERRRS